MILLQNKALLSIVTGGMENAIKRPKEKLTKYTLLPDVRKKGNGYGNCSKFNSMGYPILAPNEYLYWDAENNKFDLCDKEGNII